MAGRGAQGTRILHQTLTAFIDVEAVTNISGPNGTAATIDTTDLRSTGKENIPGLADYGQLTLDLNYTDGAEQVKLFDMFSTHADPEPFRLALPTDSTMETYVQYDFLASVSGCVFGAKVDDKQTLQITLKTSGGMTRTPDVDAADITTEGALMAARRKQRDDDKVARKAAEEQRSQRMKEASQRMKDAAAHAAEHPQQQAA